MNQATHGVNAVEGECFDRSMLLGELVSEHPEAAQVLKSFKIDFCCGGNRPFRDVVKEHDLDENEVVQALNEACKRSAGEGSGSSAANWLEAPLSDLIHHIVRNHHQFLYRSLPELTQYVMTIESVHGARHPELVRIRKLYAGMNKELMEHLPKEELDLFPAINRLEEAPSQANLEQVLDQLGDLGTEHESCGRVLKEIREITRDYTLPEDACATYQLTFRMLEELEADLFEHIHLENNILFPRAAKVAV
jgi:regulator of cell morphogenesis and NO signaling